MIDSPRSRFGFDHLVDRTAAWALEERKRARTSHDLSPDRNYPRGDIFNETPVDFQSKMSPDPARVVEAQD